MKVKLNDSGMKMNRMDVNRVIDEVEMINENANMSDSKRESHWELNSDLPHFSILVSLIFKEISRSPIELYNSPIAISNYFTFI